MHPCRRRGGALAGAHGLLDASMKVPIDDAMIAAAPYLTDWHPGEPLAEFFMSSAELGGGALLDESHWVDLMQWFFGRPESLSARVEKIPDLEITSDDNVDMMINFTNGLRANLHLDLYCQVIRSRRSFQPSRPSQQGQTNPPGHRLAAR